MFVSTMVNILEVVIGSIFFMFCGVFCWLVICVFIDELGGNDDGE